MIPYTIYEIQTDRENKVFHLPPVDRIDENEAWSEFYLKLAYAAKSDVYIHTVMLCAVDGRLIQSKSFMHGEAYNEPSDNL